MDEKRGDERFLAIGGRSETGNDFRRELKRLYEPVSEDSSE
jgi:hypothetical protein